MYFDLVSCKLCPHVCGVNRDKGELGVCKIGANPLVASVVLHKGEEPIISGEDGICNVFFAHCNLSCVYCQNFQISSNKNYSSQWLDSFDAIIYRIVRILDKGINVLGFVSPTHQVPQMVTIVEMLASKGYHPVIVYNSNAYDSPMVLRELNGLVDVYLPDFKYYNNTLARRYSNVKKYREIATLAIKEMIWQKGTSLQINNLGILCSGVIVRHLVLPGHAEDSIHLLEYLEDEFSANLALSLMSQYSPIGNIAENFKNLGRALNDDEYNSVTEKLAELGFYRGFIQDLSSKSHYIPDFTNENPFESAN